MSNQIHLAELENAINFWRVKYPSDAKTMTLCWQARVLADEYAKLIYFKQTILQTRELTPKAKEAWFEFMNEQSQKAA